MCGICGVFDLRGETVSPAVVERMAGAMAHRGPDDAGYWHVGPAAFGHRRLSILDPTPEGHQPWISADGRYVLVFNGEIYNFLELRAQLEQAGRCFRTRCDTEVLAAALEAWGGDALPRLNGMFAFAWYDTQERRLLLARDRLGIKPLYYARQKGLLVFASELGALRAGGLLALELSPAALDAYFTYLYIPEPDTVYRGVQALRPGNFLWADEHEVREDLYWRLRFDARASWSMEEAAAAYRALLEDAVRLQRVSDVPLGAFLSGGVDSASVVGVLAHMLHRPVKTFTIGFDDAQANELRYARIAARHFGTDHAEAMLHPDLAALLPELVGHFGQPFADSSMLPMWLVSRLARAEVTVALSGDGGDELFAGYTWTHMNCRVARYRAMPGWLRGMAGHVLDAMPASRQVDKVRRFHRDAGLGFRESFRRRLTCFSMEERDALYQPEFAAAARAGAVDRFLEHADSAGTISEEDWMLYQDTVMYLPGDILTKADRMSMAHGLEVRVPMLDHRLVEFAATLPFALKFDGRSSKRVAKYAMRDLVPPELLKQRKRGFAIPIDSWFRGPLAGHFEETVLAPGAYCHAYLRPETARKLFDAHRAGRVNAGHRLWTLLVLEHWMRGEDRTDQTDRTDHKS